MADDQTGKPSGTLKGAILTLNPKIVLAFFLITLAAILVVFFTIIMVRTSSDGKPPLDPGTIALLAGFVTTFLLMAKSASDYQFTSSAGSDKKDDAQTAVSKALAEKVPAPAPVAPTPASPAPSAIVIPWWTQLTDAEKSGIAGAAVSDPKAALFMVAAQAGKATGDDLDYLVSKNLLTQDRADAIKAT